MTSRIELRKEQQRQVSTNTPSIGWVAGESVVTIADRHTGLMPPQQELAVVDDGFLVRAYREDYIPEAIDPTTTTTTTTGLTIGPRNPKKYWQNVGLEGSPTFSEFTSSSDISDVYVSLETGTRPTVTRTITVISPTEYEVSDGETLAVWTETTARRTVARIENPRVVGKYNTRAEAKQAQQALLKLDFATEFGSLVDTYGLNLHRRSSRSKETRANTLFLDPNGGRRAPATFEELPSDSDGMWSLIIYSCGSYLLPAGKDPQEATRIGYGCNTQITGWQPANATKRSGTPPFTGEGQLIVPVDIAVEFVDAGGSVVETQTVTVPDTTTTLHTLHIQRTSTTATPSIKVTVGENGEHNAWLRSFFVPLPRQFSNASTDTYTLSRAIDVDGEVGDFPIQLFGHAKPINVPDIATLAGTRPDEYTTYSGTWDGTTFQQLRCRCPAWILYDVLTNERYGIALPAARIDAQSFLESSKYCQSLINNKPRWAYDGTLKGTQQVIIDNLLRLMRGWLVTAPDGRLCLKVEKDETARWIVCPAVVGEGRIDYRSALERPRIRATFTNRLTGQEEATEGLGNARAVEVPWQDAVVVQRWADWETYRDQNLLDTVEFTLPWAYHKVGVGDLIALHDPLHAGVRAAGRIVSSGADWVQLDGVPNYWPQSVATATLKQQERKAAIDPDLWGFVSFKTPTSNPPVLQLQKADGGFTTHNITEIAFEAGGRPERNRVYVSSVPANLSARTVWAITGAVKGTATEDIAPTRWRVQSVSEGDSGRTFRVVATRWVKGMHSLIESNTALPNTPTLWTPECGTKLSTFQGDFSMLNERYPDPSAGPFDDGGTFDDLTSSCV